jgi:aspartate/methionine/tyrosine aminotransferase
MANETTENEAISATAVELPLDRDAVRRLADAETFDLRKASIREMNRLVNAIEQEFSMRFVRMEFGVPGLPTPKLAIDAEVEALRAGGVGHVYAPFEGLPALKEEASRFAERFMGVEIPPNCCVPTVGAMEGCFASLVLAANLFENRQTVLCLEPGFPVNKLQIRLLGLKRAALDLYDHRGASLVEAIDHRVAQGDVCAILWSSPNNPAWVALNEDELAGIGRICDRYSVLAIEDLAYFGMDVRQDYTRPGEPPYQPTVLRHTQRGVCIVSSSKMFSYAGQRIAITYLSPGLMRLDAQGLVARLGSDNVSHALIHGVLYPLCACVPQGPQHGLTALLRAANEGDATVFAPAREYARRAAVLKPLFLDNGFRLVYDNDLGEPLADGFYFTIAYPGFDDGADLMIELLHYGISAITLETTGSNRIEGLRACVSLIGDGQVEELERRLQAFRADHPGG